MTSTPAEARARPPGLRVAALAWAELHALLFLVLYARPIAAAVASAPGSWQAWLWPTFPPQALLLGVVIWLVTLPLSAWPRAYVWAAPAMTALATFLAALDARIYGSLGYHMNAFFFSLIAQPGALREAGVPVSDLFVFGGLGAAFAVGDVLAGRAFVVRVGAASRRSWPWALAVALLATGERFYGGALAHFGGPAFFAASTVLPLQIPVRIGAIMQRLVGQARADPFAGADNRARKLPPGVAPSEIRFTTRPDVLVLVAESFPFDNFSEQATPNLWRRAASGARFPNHYSGASTTEFAIFSIVYGLQAQKLDATVGAGRRAPLFATFRANGYRVRVLASSCIDWMGMRETVFGDMKNDLETWCEGHDPRTSDQEMIESATRYVAGLPGNEPVFLFLFFFGTHFNYFPQPEDVHFQPQWDGSGGLKATTAPGVEIQNRARNAARTLDRRIEGFLSAFEKRRGRPPLVVFTGDHGEEFRQKGHIGHGSQVTREQVNVPAVWFGPGVPPGLREAPTCHADLVPTLFRLLGDTHAPPLYSDGMSVFDAPLDRFVVTTVGWEPRYAVVGLDLKVEIYGGIGTGRVTDLDDRLLPDGSARLARNAGRILRALRGELGAAGQP